MNQITWFDRLKGFLNPRLKKRFSIGTSVVVSKEGGWQKNSYGTVARGPEPVKTLLGVDYYYWVKFDKPENDLSDDGPYYEAQVLSRFVSKAPPHVKFSRLPTALRNLIDSGVWPSGENAMTQQESNPIVSKDIIKSISADDDKLVLASPPFYTLDLEVAESTFFREIMEQEGPSIDLSKAVVIGDFGIGSDAPIVLLLDGEVDLGVYYLKYESNTRTASCSWVKVFESFDQFATKIGFVSDDV